MPGLATGPFTIDLRMFNPGTNDVAFIPVKGHNRGECVNKYASKYPMMVITDAAEPVFVGAVDMHKWNHDGSVCVNCGMWEHMAVDEACSGIYGLF